MNFDSLPVRPWVMRVVFLDDGVEREGPNIAMNIDLMKRAAVRGEFRMSRYERIVRQLWIRTAQNEPQTRCTAPSDEGDAGKQTAAVNLVADSVLSPRPPMTSSLQCQHRRFAKPDWIHKLQQFSSKLHPDGLGQVPTKCSQCGLRSDDPGMLEVRHTSWANEVPYPIAAGVANEQELLEKLWRTVASLHLTPAQKQLPLEECIKLVKLHFVSRIGVPPWVEALYQKQRAARQHEQAGDEAVNEGQRRIAALREMIRDSEIELATLTKVLTSDPAEEKLNDLSVRGAKKRLAGIERSLKVAVSNNEAKKVTKQRQLEELAQRMEEIVRCIAVIAELQKLSESFPIVTSQCTKCAAVARNQLAKFRVHPIRDSSCDIQSLSITQSVNIAATLKSPRQQDIQCKHCLLSTCFSPHCPLSGVIHDESVVDSPCSRSEVAVKVMKRHSIATAEATSLSSSISQCASSEEMVKTLLEKLDQQPPTDDVPRAVDETEKIVVKPKREQRHVGRTKKSVVAENQQSTQEPATHETPHRVHTMAPRKASSDSPSAEQHSGASPANQSARPTEHPPTQTAADTSKGGFSLPFVPELEITSVQETFSHSVGTVLLPPIDKKVVNDPALTLLLRHMNEFLLAATARNVTKMKGLTNWLQTANSAAGLLSQEQRDVVSTAEEVFLEWYADMEPRLFNLDDLTSRSNTVSPQRLRPTATPTLITTKELISLRRELRNLQYAFAKRPQGHSPETKLDDNTFTLLAVRISELEKKEAHLNAKLKLLESHHQVLTHKIKNVSPCPSPAPLTKRISPQLVL